MEPQQNWTTVTRWNITPPVGPEPTTSPCSATIVSDIKDTLSLPAWTPLHSDQTAAGPSTVTTDNLGTNPQRFERAVLVQ